MEVHIRQAEPADRDQLALLREALWPATSATEHARELGLILAGETPGTMPLVNFVAETVDGRLCGFAEVDLRSHADGRRVRRRAVGTARELVSAAKRARSEATMEPGETRRRTL